MGQIPPWSLVHRVSVEPFLGRNADGPVYGPAQTHRCLITHVRRLTRSPDDRQLVASLALHFAPGTDIPAESRVTPITPVAGPATTAVSVQVRDGGGLPTPDHVLVLCE